MALSGADASLVGKVLDQRYELLEIIGDGGVGVVYGARRVKLERKVAVKVLHEALVEEPGFAPRFEREAVALSRLHHPHCVAVIDFGMYQTRPYLVLEYVPGQNIRKLLQQGPFDPLRAVRIGLQLLETLEYFHERHVIHRDLKSENVMLADSGGASDFVKVLDFGMAKILTGPGADSQLSKIGIVPGTPSAMAPEQIQQLPPDPRIDIYATGILMYEMIVGRRPFSGDAASVVKMQLSATPKPPREVLGEAALSAELEQVVIKALEKDRIDRFGTAAEMAAALRLTPEGRASVVPSVSDLRLSPLPAAGPSPAPPPPEGTPARASNSPLIAGLIIAVALVAGVGVLRWPKEPPPKRTAPVVIASAIPAPAPAPSPPPAPPPVVETAPAVEAQAGADPALVQALIDTAAKGATLELRHAAYDDLRTLGQEQRADLVAMQTLDVEQAQTCSTMRDAFKKLRASSDPRVKQLASNLRKRSRRDPHVRCLKRLLQSRR